MPQSIGIKKSMTVGHQKKWKTTKALTASVSLEWQGSPVGSQCLKVTWSTSQRTKVLGQLPPVSTDRPDRRASNNRAPQPIPSHCTVSIPTSCALMTFLLLSQSFNWWTCYGILSNFSALVIFTQLILTDWQIMELPTSPANDIVKDTYVLSSLSWYQCLQMQASCLTDYYYCTGREPWMEILESGPWENSNGKAYATVVLTITSAKTRNLFRLPVQVNCLRAWLKEWKKIKLKELTEFQF